MLRRCLPLLLLLVVGCTRKLPGPAECRAYAEAATDLSGRRVSLYQAQVAAELAEKLTVECLTTPWDRQLLQCLHAGNSSRVCRAQFAARISGAPTPIQLIR